MCKAGHKQTPPVVLHKATASTVLSVWKNFTPCNKAVTPRTSLWIGVAFRGFVQTLSPAWCVGLVWFGLFFFSLQCTLCAIQGTYFANVSPASVFGIVLKILLHFSQSHPHTEMVPHIWRKGFQVELLLQISQGPCAPGWQTASFCHCQPAWLRVSRKGMWKKGWPNSPSDLHTAFRKDQSELRMGHFPLFLFA